MSSARNATYGFGLVCRSPAAGMVAPCGGRQRCYRLLLVLALCLGGMAATPATFTDAAGAPVFQQLKSFGKLSLGSFPSGELIQGADGALYGAASQGGTSGYGTVFKLNTDGTGFTVLENFDYASTGGGPQAGLVEGADGALYGAANQGGTSGYGTVFKLNTDGTGFTVLKNFDYSSTGGFPQAGLVEGADGALYGTAQAGGTSGYGTVFKLNTDGTGFTVLQNFDYSSTGGFPSAGLVEGADGALYGTASGGGTSGYGTVFKLNTDGTGFTVLQNFDYSSTGGLLYASLVEGADGALYSTANLGGASDAGTVFKLNTDGTGFTVLQNFDYSSTGGSPFAGLVEGADGALYGTAVAGGASDDGTVFKLNTDGTGFTVLQNFDDASTGGFLYGGLVEGADGALYGTALTGGTSGGGGTVFKLNTDGTGFTVLQHLSVSPDIIEEGGYPYAGLVEGADGALYGTASQGGTSGAGTVFKLNTDGTGFTVLQNFDYSSTGGGPQAGLVEGADGALYGTASGGGTSGYGTVFKLNTDGTGFTVLKNFDYSSTGGFLYARLVEGADGALYGTTNSGGTSGYGTVFKLNTDGTGFTVLQNFDYSSTGGSPYGGLVEGADGALYGTAYQGGTSGYGTVFKLNTDGTGFTVLQNFDYSSTGGYPSAGLVEGADGALYGTAQAGGTSGYGTAFTLNTDGTGFTVLQNFDYSSTGGYLSAGLVEGADGALYGTAQAGGTSGYGTAFTLNTDGTGFTVLENFDSSSTGRYPYSGLVEGADGNLYGTTYGGGDAGAGTVYRLVFNTPPVADAGDDFGVDEGASVVLDGTESDDADGDTLTFAWTQVGGPTVTLAGEFTATPSFTAPFVSAGGEELTFELTVDDDNGGIATDTVVISVQNINDPPIASAAQPTIPLLWPPNHHLVAVGIAGVVDPDNNATITITGVMQDEPTNGLGDGDTAIDAVIPGDGTVLLRAERSGTGNGRVYHVHFTASDLEGSVSGVVTVSVPHNKKSTAIDGGELYDSTE